MSKSVLILLAMHMSQMYVVGVCVRVLREVKRACACVSMHGIFRGRGFGGHGVPKRR